MKKRFLLFVLLVSISEIISGQTNFNGTWIEPDLEIIEGIQYSNAMPKTIKVIQTKDSITLERTTLGNDGDITVKETFPLNGNNISRVTKTSKRTINTTAVWSGGGKMLTIVATYSYAERPVEVEYKNTEVWILADDQLVITKTSDATVTDDWIIRGTYKRM